MSYNSPCTCDLPTKFYWDDEYNEGTCNNCGKYLSGKYYESRLKAIDSTTPTNYGKLTADGKQLPEES